MLVSQQTTEILLGQILLLYGAGATHAIYASLLFRKGVILLQAVTSFLSIKVQHCQCHYDHCVCSSHLPLLVLIAGYKLDHTLQMARWL